MAAPAKTPAAILSKLNAELVRIITLPDVRERFSAQAFTVVGPHVQSGGVGSTRGRLGAAVAIGLLAGIIGAVLLDVVMRRRASGAGSLDQAPAAMRREAERRADTSAR